MQNRSFAQYLFHQKLSGLRFRSRSGFDIEQYPLFSKAFFK
ncbi:MAG TPA: hypothetical protein VKA34_18925 [Balneolales bacterium]|nr:hypothetical protein [Balneolales bacterium]